MDFGGDRRGRQFASTAYSPGQVEAVLRSCGVEVVGETFNDFLAYCPYHGNRDTAAFSVSRIKGTFICFNPACNQTGTLLDLIKDIKHCNDFEAIRLIGKMGKSSPVTLRSHRDAKIDIEKELPLFDQRKVDIAKRNLWGPDGRGLDYLHSRGFSDDTLREYEIGYDPKRNMVTTPMHDINGRPVGFIGRSASHEVKQFKNTDNLPVRQTLWNIHRARRVGSSVIVVEANFDGMRVAQAVGHNGVVACLGGNFSPYHQAQLDRHFDTIILMTDFDDADKHKYAGCRKCFKKGFEVCQGHNPGRVLGETIAEKMAHKKILWAAYDDRMVYPDGVKDAGGMNDDQIRQCLNKKVSNFVYHTWGIAA